MSCVKPKLLYVRRRCQLSGRTKAVQFHILTDYFNITNRLTWPKLAWQEKGKAKGKKALLKWQNKRWVDFGVMCVVGFWETSFFLELRLWTKLSEQSTCSLFMQVEITEKYYCLELLFFFEKINLFQSEIY